MNAIRRLWVSDSGQALIETALCMPVLALFLAGVIDLGRLSQFDLMLASGARAGAQYGSQNTTNAADITGMQRAATNDAPTVTVTASSYYKCADGAAPPTPPPVLTMNATASINCSANHQLLYVVVTTAGAFKPIFLLFLSSAAAQTRTAIMQVGT
jgi:Flp pilus assembly protein TadG